MDSVEERRVARGRWVVEVRPGADQAGGKMEGSASDRLRALAELSITAWRLAGKPLPTYARHAAPVAVTDSRASVAS